jgi:hypothetical protein
MTEKFNGFKILVRSFTIGLGWTGERGILILLVVALIRLDESDSAEYPAY